PIFDGQAPFANNGTIPDGSQVAFLQSTSSIRTTITNLVPNTNYTVRFRANARSVYKPNLRVGIDGQSVLDTFWSNVGGTNDYRFVAFDFVASNTTALLSLTNDIAGDHTVLLDNFTIAPSTSHWAFANWTNDASSGIDPSKLYTHAFYFGATTPNTNINGVVFRGAPGANPSVLGFMTTVGFGNVFTGDANVLTTAGGGSAGIASQFIYGGPVQVITLSGLQPGTEYVASIFGVGFDVRAYGRSATFNVGTDRMTINLDHFGNDQGIIVSYRYVADASGSIVLTYTPTDSASTFHTYAVANRVAVDSIPIIGVQPMNTFTAIGTITTLVVGLSAGSLPLYYQWQLDGVDLLGETNSTLVLTNLNAYSSSNYRVVVTNFLGAVTSAVANVEVGIKLTEVFNTGVDETNQFLSGGQVDSHYRLTSSPDPFFPGPDALVMHNGAFPLAGNYFTNGLFSSWISPRTNSTPGNSNGYYFYRTAFIIDTADPAHAQINGRWASDNEGIDIRLNGVSLGISNNVSAAFIGFVPFVITNGFIAGSNTIDFVISNGPATGPTALRVEMAGVGRPLAPAAPQIVNEPTGGTVLKNSSVALSALATGSGPLSYQWFFEGSPITDQTNRVLRFPSIQLAQSGNYSVTITNAVGTTNSATANLNVVAPPLVLVGPDSVIVSCSEETSFVVEYEGTQPITFQWYFGTNAIPGETGDFLVVPNVHPAQAGSYFVVLTGPGGSYTSSVATLTLNDFVAPVINGGTNLLVCTASNSAPVTFAATATDDCDPNPSLVCTPASGSTFPLGTNFVTCVATDANGNSTTNTFTVTVFKAAQPTATNVNRSGTTVTFGFQTENGCTYRVEKTDSLSPASWSFLENIVGDGSVKIATDPDATVPMRFYRIIVQ
ncbi:MAG TPA: immunoglobulin domain-containing protein, partial [Verrucomicrobiae bacterium]